MPLPKAKFTGSQGSWNITVKLPGQPAKTRTGVHQRYIKKVGGKLRYHDPYEGFRLDGAKNIEQSRRMREDGEVVVQTSDFPAEGGPPIRTGYVGLFSIDPDTVIFDDDGLRFDFIARLADA
jgi:hypothetical protein